MTDTASIDDVDRNEQLRQILGKLLENPRLAHDFVFAKRHTHATPAFHREIIADFWSAQEYTGTEAFREGAKSTLAEEGITLMALFGLEPFILIVGANYDRAVDRLTAIKHEIDNNEIIQELWGNQRGEVWNEGEVVLKNGVKIQALGARMKFRGVKYKNDRPRFVLIDDLEDEENTATDEKRAKLAKWVSRVLLPACRRARKRIVGTPLHPNSWLEAMRKNSGWPFRIYPIVVPASVNPEDWEHAQWESRYPLSVVRNIRDEYERAGDLQGFVQEYLCRSEDASLKPFQEKHLIAAQAIPPQTPSLVIADPARTARPGRSARTGYSVVSWFGSSLYVRHAFGGYDMPDQIINNLFMLDDTFNPVWIAVEKDGLEQFLMQPLRQEMLKRGKVLPIRPLMAPRDRSKEGFIRGLQPFFEAGEIKLCGEFPELRAEILNFPTGLNDILNTIAYALRLRAGRPVYEDFSFNHIAPDNLKPNGAQSVWLVLNVEPQFTTGVLVQYVNRSLRVFGDWVKEGGPEEALEQMLPEAIQCADGKAIKYFAPMDQFDEFNNLGLSRALRRLRIHEITKGPKIETAQGSLTTTLRASAMHQPAFLVSPGARWTINGLSQGYARSLDKTGVLSQDPEPGYYATGIRGLESFAKWLTVRVEDTAGEQSQVNYAYTPSGQRYISSRASTGVDNGRRENKR